MSSLTQTTFLKALADKFDPYELCDLLEVDSVELIEALMDKVLENQSMLEEELKYGH